MSNTPLNDLMPWTEPKTWSRGETITARDLNADWPDWLSWIYEAIYDWRKRNYRNPDRIHMTPRLRMEILRCVDNYRAVEMRVDGEEWLFGLPLQPAPYADSRSICFALA